MDNASRLRSGEQAVTFDAVAFNGAPVRLADLRGKKVWLCFYRYFGCPFCRSHMYDVVDRYAELARANLEVVAFFDSRGLKLGAANREKFPTFPLVTDPDGAVYSAYGIERRASVLFDLPAVWKFFQAWRKGIRQGAIDGDLRLVPAHFLIHEDGLIHTAHYNQGMTDHISWAVVEEFLRVPARPLPKRPPA